VSVGSLAWFVEECGGAVPLELEVGDRARERVTRWVLPQPFALLGSKPDADVVLSDEQVSARHAYLQVLDGRVRVFDLHSRTGIVWPDGTKRSGVIHPQEEVTVGPFAVRLVRGGHDTPTADAAQVGLLPPPPYGGRTLPRVGFEFLRKGELHHAWEMVRAVVLVGSSAECKLCLKHESVSRVHCSLVRTPRGVWVVDLRGRGGIVVNGSAVRFALLEEGDELLIGKFRLRCRYGMATPSALLLKNAARPSVLAAPVPGAGQRGTDLAVSPSASAAEALLLPLVTQFASMQQQMFDQFQQALGMVLQAFGAWHSDQADLIRQELQQLNATTQELQGLQSQLAQQHLEKQVAGALPREAAFDRGADARPAQSAPLPVAKDRPTTAETREQCESSASAAVERPKAQAASAHDPAEDIHTWLTQRIASLEGERQSTWKRLLGFLSGTGAGAPAP